MPSGDGVEDFGYSVADVVFHDVADEESGEEDADYGVDQIEVVGFRRVEVVRQEILYPVYQHLQYQGGECREDTYQKS